MNRVVETASAHRVKDIGFKAYAALCRCSGIAHPIAGLANSGYWRAEGEIVWIGSRTGAMHPRAVLVDTWRAPDVGPVHIELAECLPWSPRPLPVGAMAMDHFRAQCLTLQENVAELGTPAGFGMLLDGRSPVPPLDLRVPHVLMVADAYRRDDPQAAYEASLALLGVGPGLTPSGDDFTGGALFAKRLLARNCPSAETWRSVATRLTAAVEVRSHSLSAALFTDMAEGHSFAALHRLAEVLAEDAPAREIIAAARSLVTIGHSSGWDMLAGFIAGVDGTLLDARARHGDHRNGQIAAR